MRKLRTHRALRDTLRALPEGLFETYDRILERIDHHDHEYVSRMLKWLIGSVRPLKLEELAEAIAIDPSKIELDPEDRFRDPTEILDLCSSLITLRSDNVIVLAHFSVREYLLSDRLAKQPPCIAKFAITRSESNRHIARCYMTYVFTIGIQIRGLGRGVFDERTFPLFRYITIASIARYLDFDAVRPWVEVHFPSDDKGYQQFLHLVAYASPPAVNEDNYRQAGFVQYVLQCALMCYWNGCARERELPIESLPMGTIEHRIASMFRDLQHDWYVQRRLNNICKYVIYCVQHRRSPFPLQQSRLRLILYLPHVSAYSHCID